MEEIITLGIISTSNLIRIGGWVAWKARCADGCTPSRFSNKSAIGRRHERDTSPQTPLTRRFLCLSSWMLFHPSWLSHAFYPIWTWSPFEPLAACPNRPIRSVDPSSRDGIDPCKGSIPSSTSSNNNKEEEERQIIRLIYLHTQSIYLSITVLALLFFLDIFNKLHQHLHHIRCCRQWRGSSQFIQIQQLGSQHGCCKEKK